MLRPVVDNARRGERIVILRSGADTDGELLLFDAFLQPGAHVPASHVHPQQEERFTILSGILRFRVGGQTLVAERGMSLTVPGGTPHWFGNVGESVAQVRVEVRPALRMQELFGTVGWLNWLLIPRDFQKELAVPHVPAWAIVRLLAPLAWLRNRVQCGRA
jgi:mannose-6-phosphate isomerase-like protein (cupin superfamily)